MSWMIPRPGLEEVHTFRVSQLHHCSAILVTVDSFKWSILPTLIRQISFSFFSILDLQLSSCALYSSPTSLYQSVIAC